MLESHTFDQPLHGKFREEGGEKQIEEAIQLNAIDINEGKLYSGELVITRYKIVFNPDESKNKEINPSYDDCSDSELSGSLGDENFLPSIPEYKKRYFNIPVHMFYNVSFESEKKNIQKFYITVHTKDFREVRFIMTDYRKGKHLFETLNRVAFPNFLWKDVFALKYEYQIKNSHKEYRIKMDLPINGWDVYDMEDEFKRQGVFDLKETFRIQNCWYTNDEDNICATYPYQVIVPAKMTPVMVANWAAFRAK